MPPSTRNNNRMGFIHRRLQAHHSFPADNNFLDQTSQPTAVNRHGTAPADAQHGHKRGIETTFSCSERGVVNAK